LLDKEANEISFSKYGSAWRGFIGRAADGAVMPHTNVKPLTLTEVGGLKPLGKRDPDYSSKITIDPETRKRIDGMLYIIAR